jgi:hypothetical protein
VAPIVGFFVGGEWCGRCGDQNYDPATKLCLTCTYPNDPCSRAYLDANPLGSRPIRPSVARTLEVAERTAEKAREARR